MKPQEQDAGAGVRRSGPIPISDPDVVDLVELVAMFRRRLRLMIITMLLAMGVAALVTFQLTPRYAATAQVVIDQREGQTVDVEAVLSGLPASSAVVDTEVRILNSREVAGRVVDELNLVDNAEFNPRLRPPSATARWIADARAYAARFLPTQAQPEPEADRRIDRAAEREEVVSALLRAVTARRHDLTFVIMITATSEDPQTAARIANVYAEQYQLSQLQTKFDATRRASQWLEARLVDLREEVLTSEQAVETYRSAEGLLTTGGRTLTEQQIADLNAQLVIQRQASVEAEQRLASIRGQIARGVSLEAIGEVIASPVIADLRSDQADITRQRADLATRYGPNHPEMRRIARESDDLQRELDREVDRIVASVESEVRVAQGRVRALDENLERLRNQLSTNNRALVRLRELERVAESTRAIYAAFLDRFKEVGDQEGLQEPDARIVSVAPVPRGPSFPNTRLNLALGAVAGLALGAGLVILAELFDRGLRTGADIERWIGLQHLASIPELRKSEATIDGVRLSPEDYILERPLSVFAEAYRSLRSAITFSNIDRKRQVVLITSALPGEGKSASALCLGRISAMAGTPTLVVDCDLRRRGLTRAIGATQQPGLLEAILSDADLDTAILQDSETSLHVLPSGAFSHAGDDVFSSEVFRGFLADLSKRYELIILDAAPALALASTRLLAQHADSVVVMAEWRRTSRQLVRQAVKLMSEAHGRVIGGALTRVDRRAADDVRYGEYNYRRLRRYYSD